jgi:hypothetical protein
VLAPAPLQSQLICFGLWCREVCNCSHRRA